MDLVTPLILMEVDPGPSASPRLAALDASRFSMMSSVRVISCRKSCGCRSSNIPLAYDRLVSIM